MLGAWHRRRFETMLIYFFLFLVYEMLFLDSAEGKKCI